MEGVQQRSGNKKRRVILSNDVGLSQVLFVITKSNVLTKNELGRLLLFVSKRMTASAFREREDVWKCLCFSQWGKHDAEMLMETTGLLSAEQCFRKLATHTLRNIKHIEVPQALQYSRQDYRVIVSVRDRTKDKPIFCETISGQDVPDFFEKGEMQVEFDKPHWKCVVDKDKKFYAFLDWEAKVHLMRLPDQRIIQLANVTHRRERIYPCSDTGSEECSVKLWGGGSSDLGLPINNTYGRALMECYCQSGNRFRFETQLVYRMTNTTQTNDTLAIFGFRLYTDFFERTYWDWCKFGFLRVSEAIADEDVTFAHFLEALDAWAA